MSQITSVLLQIDFLIINLRALSQKMYQGKKGNWKSYKLK